MALGGSLDSQGGLEYSGEPIGLHGIARGTIECDRPRPHQDRSFDAGQDFFEMMSNYDQCGTCIGDRLKSTKELMLGSKIKSRGRFVQNESLRGVYQGTREHDPTTLAG